MIDRRKFIKTLSALGISVPAIKSELLGKTSTAKKDNPIILCSRGEKWGRKVLKPGWDKQLSKLFILLNLYFKIY